MMAVEAANDKTYSTKEHEGLLYFTHTHTHNMNIILVSEINTVLKIQIHEQYICYLKFYFISIVEIHC